MTLDDLPKICIESIDVQGDTITVQGRFDRAGNARANGYLRLARGDYAWIDMRLLDPAAGTVAFSNARDRDVARLRAGHCYTYLDDYWDAPLVEAIADTTTVWREVTFVPSDAEVFQQNGVTGWQPVGSTLPEGAVATGIVAAGWDHEHCSLCDGRIDVEQPVSYEASDGALILCASCFRTYAARHDLSFMAGRTDDGSRNTRADQSR